MWRKLLLGIGIVLALSSQQAFGWARVGHAAIATIAEDLLTPDVRSEVDRLLALEGARSMADVASWADEVKDQEKWSHVVRIPLDATSFVPEDCPAKRCIVFGIKRNLEILSDMSRSDEERLEALKFVVHLVGDIHVPLHVVAKDLSHMQALYRGRPRTIHKMWDALIINDTGLTARELAEKIVADGLTAGVAQESPEAWALESRDIARDVIIPDVDESKAQIQLADDYGARMLPVIEKQLGRAGARLADVLNEALKPATN